MATHEERYREAIKRCGHRYRDMMRGAGIKEDDALFRFNSDLIFACGEASSPVLKMCRWLGYIQGMLIARGLTNVEAERNWTRGLFRPLDFPEQEEKPALPEPNSWIVEWHLAPEPGEVGEPITRSLFGNRDVARNRFNELRENSLVQWVRITPIIALQAETRLGARGRVANVPPVREGWL